MFLMMLHGSSAAQQVDLPGAISVSDAEIDVDSLASFTLDNTGAWSSVGNELSPSGTWKLTGVVADYECRATVTSGSLTSGTAGSWLGLGTTRTWTREDTSITGGEQVVVFTLEIRRVSDGVILDSASVSLSAYKESSA